VFLSQLITFVVKAQHITRVKGLSGLYLRALQQAQGAEPFKVQLTDSQLSK